MFDYNIFDNVEIAMHKARAYSKLKKELKNAGLSSLEVIDLCQKRKQELVESKKDLEIAVSAAKAVRDSAVEAWIDEYGTGDEKNDLFDAMDDCYEEDKAFERELDALLKCEGAIKAYEKTINLMNNKMTMTAAKTANKR